MYFDKLGISRKFWIINRKLRHMFDDAFAASGVTGTQAAVLHFVYTKGKYRDVFQRDIETVFNIRRSSVTSLLQGLERKGFILRENVQEDCRLKKLVLTDKSINIADHIQHKIDKLNNTILDGLSTNEVNFLNALLTQIEEKLP